jgi:hypothetical protein
MLNIGFLNWLDHVLPGEPTHDDILALPRILPGDIIRVIGGNLGDALVIIDETDIESGYYGDTRADYLLITGLHQHTRADGSITYTQFTDIVAPENVIPASEYEETAFKAAYNSYLRERETRQANKKAAVLR